MSQHSLTDLTSHCIRCGFCLEDCPTFKITGEEHESPRGRIYLVRSAEEGKLDWDEARPHLDRCLGCRACETACPSGVEYGAILELARERLGAKPATKMLLSGLTDSRKARLQFQLGAMMPGKRMPALLSKWVSGETPEANIPRVGTVREWPTVDESALPPIRGEVALLMGCVMQVLYPDVHEATRRLLRRVGYRVHDVLGGCCGALHAHSGMTKEAGDRLTDLKQQLPPGMPLIVNSAGCGSTLKESDLKEQTLDASEFLLANGLVEVIRSGREQRVRLTYHDACHLAHGQGVRSQPRELLRAIPGIEFVELEEADTCCGSAGIYNIQQPLLARRLLERKWEFVQQSGAQIVATGNPGCHAWIAQRAEEAGQQVQVLHTLQAIEMACSGMLA